MRGDYDRQTIISEICTRLIEGESLRAICRDEAMPAISTVMLWLTEDEKLSEQYARAKAEQADTLFQETLEIADTADNESVQVARLRIDTRKWMAGKLRPKVYGDKLAVGGDKDMDPIQTEQTGEGVAALRALVSAVAERNRVTGDVAPE